MYNTEFNIFSLAKRIGRPLILDGAMGSLLQQKGYADNSSLWSAEANIKYSDEVVKIHTDYISAGADIITTNTFRTNPSAVRLSGRNYNPGEMVSAALRNAKRARGNFPVFIAGSNPPAEDCYQAERTLSEELLKVNHTAHLDLLKTGVDFVLNETQSHFDEIKFICEYCYSNSINYVISFYFTEELKLLSDMELFDAVNNVCRYKPMAIGFNCISLSAMEKVIQMIPGDLNWGFYLNCGNSTVDSREISCGIDEHEYLAFVKRTLPHNPSFIGACCGSTPNHIGEIKKYLDGLHRN